MDWFILIRTFSEDLAKWLVAQMTSWKGCGKGETDKQIPIAFWRKISADTDFSFRVINTNL